MSEKTFEEKYPEHIKMSKIKDDANAIGCFIDWLWNVEKVVFAKYDGQQEQLYATFTGTEKMLAKYYGIDLHIIEIEKQQMLEEIRKQNQK